MVQKAMVQTQSSVTRHNKFCNMSYKLPLVSILLLQLVIWCGAEVHDSIRATEPILTTDPLTKQLLAKTYYYNPAENELSNWYDSMQWCQTRGYEPGRVESAAENQLVSRTLIENFGSSHVFWLGATDWGQDGEFYWLRTGQKFVYNSFAAGYPNGGPAESCAYVWGDGNWYDQYCTVPDVRPLCQVVTFIEDLP